MNFSQGGEAQQVSQAIRYMEFCVNVLGETEQAIHNYLLSLYARGQPASLLAYLEQAGTSPHRVHYDLKYALRLCAEHGHHRACVHVYKVLELYEEAVDLALQVDVDLAKQCADLPEEDEELRKKLWLKIARHVVQEEEDVQTAMACLASCSLLKIEDVMPFFPDFVAIDHFKEAICSSLKAYIYHIQELQQEMVEATASARASGEICRSCGAATALCNPRTNVPPATSPCLTALFSSSSVATCSTLTAFCRPCGLACQPTSRPG